MNDKTIKEQIGECIDETIKEYKKLREFCRILVPMLKDHNLNSMATELESRIFTLDQLTARGNELSDKKDKEQARKYLEVVLDELKLTDEKKALIRKEFEEKF